MIGRNLTGRRKWNETSGDEVKACRHCGKQPHHSVAYDDPQVAEWHRIECRNKKCKVNPHELSMAKGRVTEQWNQRMACADCKLADQLILTLNARLDAVKGHTEFTRAKVKEHRWRS